MIFMPLNYGNVWESDVGRREGLSLIIMLVVGGKNWLWGTFEVIKVHIDQSKIIINSISNSR